jgi:hypothetical protein
MSPHHRNTADHEQTTEDEEEVVPSYPFRARYGSSAKFDANSESGGDQNEGGHSGGYGCEESQGLKNMM